MERERVREREMKEREEGRDLTKGREYLRISSIVVR